MPEKGAEYSIAAVSKLTGISCHALRVWERRYGFPVPRRTPSGHRRYGADQVAQLRQVAEHLGADRPIGEVMTQLRAGALGPPPEATAPGAGPAAESARLIDRLTAGDAAGAEAEFRAQAARWTPPELMARVLEPALVEAGERWFRGDAQVFQEHHATAFLRRKLELMLDQAQRLNPAPRRAALVGTVQGERHEGGVLMVSLHLEWAGWRAIYLGVDLPAPDYQRAIDAWRPDAVCLSFVLSRNINKRFRELAGLEGPPVFVGGRSILNYRGLARRYGLHPLPGPANQAVARLIEAVESARAT